MDCGAIAGRWHTGRSVVLQPGQSMADRLKIGAGLSDNTPSKVLMLRATEAPQQPYCRTFAKKPRSTSSVL
jgi:hypothetical protein